MRSWIDVLGKSATSEDILRCKIRISLDFPYFFEKVLGFGKLNPMQDQIFDLFSLDPSFMPENKYVCVLAPRQHGKTTFCIAFMLWIAYNAEYMKTLPMYSKYPWINCLIVSSNQVQSANIVELIKYHVEENEILHHLKPETSLRDSKWSSSEVKFQTGCYIRSRPFTSAIRGGTYHFVLCDDLLRDSTILQSDAIKSYVENIIPTTGETKGMQILVGTPQTSTDLFSYIEEELVKKKEIYAFKRFSAVECDDHGDWTGTLWDERYSIKDLENMRDILGFISFAKEWLCDTRKAGEALWTWDMIEGCLDPDTKEMMCGRPGYRYFLGVDVAFSKSRTADYGVFSILEQDSAQKEFPSLIHIFRQRGIRPEEYDKKIRAYAERFKMTLVVVEERGLSKDLVMRLKVDPKLGYLIRGFITGKRGTSGDKERLIMRLHTAISNGAINLPKDRSETMNVFYNELMNFGIKEKDGKEKYEALAGHDDTVMSVAMAYDALVNPYSTRVSMELI